MQLTDSVTVYRVQTVGCVIVDPVTDTIVAASSDRRNINCLNHATMLCIGQVSECQRLVNKSSQ